MRTSGSSNPKSKKGILKLILNVILLLVFVGAVVIVSQLAIGYFLLWAVGPDDFNQPVWMATYSALSYLMAMALIILVPIKSRKKSARTDRKSLGMEGLLTWSDIGLAPIGFIVYTFLAAIIVWVFSLFPWFDVEQVQDVGFDLLRTGTDRIVAFVTLVVMAPIAEEIIFRGFLYGQLRSKLSVALSNRASMIISTALVSLLFGIMHGQWNVGVNVFAMSIVLCAMREITGTIYSGMVLHVLKNGVAFYLVYILGIS